MILGIPAYWFIIFLFVAIIIYYFFWDEAKENSYGSAYMNTYAFMGAFFLTALNT